MVVLVLTLSSSYFGYYYALVRILRSAGPHSSSTLLEAQESERTCYPVPVIYNLKAPKKTLYLTTMHIGPGTRDTVTTSASSVRKLVPVARGQETHCKLCIPWRTANFASYGELGTCSME